MRLRFEQLETRNMLSALVGTPGNDVFAAGPGWANLNGTAYVGDYTFDGRGGTDVASLYDTPGADVFTARPGSAELGNLRVTNCEIIHGYAKAGGNDTARLEGSGGNDIFIGKVAFGKLFSDQFYIRAKFFETVEVDAGDGIDVASLYDSADNDVTIMKPGDVTLFSPNHSQTVRAFDYVHAYARRGGYDTAHLYGDRYTGRETYTRAFGDGTVNRAKFFEEVMANRERVNAPVYVPVIGDTITMTGTHTLRRPIELESGDTLTGDALLQREGVTIQKTLTQNALEGALRLSVTDTVGYRLGDELTVLAYNGSGAEGVTVVGLGADWIGLENPLTGSYTTDNYAAVINYFPLVRAIGTGITIEGVTLDGNRDTNFFQWQITGGGLIYMEATNSVVDGVTVLNSPSIGILVRYGRDNLITRSVVLRSYGHGILLDQEIDTRVEYTTSSYNGDRANGDGILVNGSAGVSVSHMVTQYNDRYGLHPAGALTRGGVWEENRASENRSNGFHFCYNNFDILVTGNILNNNRSGMGGLGVGGVYGDRFNVVTNNIATANRRFGIETNGGSDNTIIGNDVRGNRFGGVLIIGNHIVEGNLE